LKFCHRVYRIESFCYSNFKITKLFLIVKLFGLGSNANEAWKALITDKVLHQAQPRKYLNMSYLKLLKKGLNEEKKYLKKLFISPKNEW
jgi:hypothetical protein